MANPMVTAGLKDIHKADDVAVDVGVGVLQGVTLPRLGGQVTDRIEPSSAKRASILSRSVSSSFTNRYGE